MKKIVIYILVMLSTFSSFCVFAQDTGPSVASNAALSLDECIKIGIQNSFEVKLAKLDLLIAETGEGVKEAVFDTVLSGDVSYEEDKREQVSVFAADHATEGEYSIGASKTLYSGTDLTLSLSETRVWDNSGFTSKNPAHEAEISLEARQPIGKNSFDYVDRRNLSITRLVIKNAGLDTRERIEVLIADIQGAYWQWVFAKENLKIFREILEKAKELHKTNTTNYDVGRIEKGDFLASQANVLIREKDVRIAENHYRQAEEKVKLLLNMDADYRVSPMDPLEYTDVKVDLEDCLHRAFERRRDYLKAKRELEIKEITLQTKKNERWPEIDLVATLTLNGIETRFPRAVDHIGRHNNLDYVAGVEVSMPLENRLAKSEFKKAAHHKEKAIVGVKNIERIIVTEVGNSYRDYITREAVLTNLIEAAKLQQEKLQEEEKRFNYGRSNTKTLIDYQQDYLIAELGVTTGVLEFELARIYLDKVLNTILEKYEEIL